jgi:hypothetical protein
MITNAIKNKKIIERFFKECGLYSAWKYYIKNSFPIKEGNVMTKVYDKRYVDAVIGETSFTRFLNRMGIFPEDRIVRVFRSYLKEILGLNISKNCANSPLLSKYAMTKFNKDFHTIKLWYQKNELE